jgi:hypothetical protein
VLAESAFLAQTIMLDKYAKEAKTDDPRLAMLDPLDCGYTWYWGRVRETLMGAVGTVSS